MSTNNPTNRSLSNPSSRTPAAIMPQLDLSTLPEETRQELAKRQAQGIIDIQHKAIEAGVDINALGSTLDTLTQSTSDVVKAGASVKIEHETQTSIGKTRVVMGNTPGVTFGNLDPSTIWVVLVVAVGILVLIGLAIVAR
jgi:hypothetical protein